MRNMSKKVLNTQALLHKFLCAKKIHKPEHPYVTVTRTFN